MSNTHMTQAEAFAALRRGGLIHDDPDLAQLFDTSDPDFVARARAAKPAWFFDAMSATPAQLAARIKQLDVDAGQRQRDLAPKPRPDFNAMTASKAEFDTELKRLGFSVPSLMGGR